MSKKGTGKFIVGAAIGAGLGLLFAPKKGSETRKELSGQMSDLWEKVKNIDSDEVKAKLEDKLREVEVGIKDLDKEKVLSIAKEKGESLKVKCNELIDMAKESGKPVVENAAKNVKKELANVTKKVLDKLEK